MEKRTELLLKLDHINTEIFRLEMIDSLNHKQALELGGLKIDRSAAERELEKLEQSGD